MPTPAENGRTVLDIYAHFRSKEDHVLLPNNFISVAAQRRIPIKDVQDGIAYASEQRWIYKTSKGFWALTRDGLNQLESAG